MNATLTDDVVVCTLDRPEDLLRTLNSVRHQSRPPRRVVIVDASSTDSTRDAVGRWCNQHHPLPFAVSRVSCEPGLPRQRNVGCSVSDADVVHFIDDDVTLDRSYIDQIMTVFEREREREREREHEVVGVGGLITNQPPHRLRWYWRVALLDSSRRGVVLPSGANTVVTASAAAQDVEWLSGCSMSFRRSLVAENTFDESLEGYALMEDVDFGYRASQAGRVVHQPTARLEHHASPVNRWARERRQRTVVCRRGWFVLKHGGRFHLVAFAWSVVAGAAAHAAVGLIARRRDALRQSWWTLLGAVDFLRGAR